MRNWLIVLVIVLVAFSAWQFIAVLRDPKPPDLNPKPNEKGRKKDDGDAV